MNEVLVRIRKVFNDTGKNQTQIGKDIKKTSQYVWKLLNDDNVNPSGSVIDDICRVYSVNDKWLRTGEGNMYQELSRNEQIQAFINLVMADTDDSIRLRFVSALSKFNADDWNSISKILDKFKDI